MPVNRESVAKTIIDAYDKSRNEYKRALSDATDEAKIGLKEGETVPNFRGRIPDGFYADAAKRHVESCRNTALNVIDKAIGEVTAALVEPPNEKALGYIMSIQGRDNLSPVEIEAALSVYGGNFAAVKAINSAAVRSGLTIHAATSQLERDYAALNDLRGKVSDFMSYERIACDDDAAHAVSKWVVSDFGEGKGGDVFE